MYNLLARRVINFIGPCVLVIIIDILQYIIYIIYIST